MSTEKQGGNEFFEKKRIKKTVEKRHEMIENQDTKKIIKEIKSISDLKDLEESVEHIVEKERLGSLKKSISFSLEQQHDNINTKPGIELIARIEHIDHIDTIVPKELRLTKQEYLEALKNSEAKITALKKLDISLDLLYRTFRGGTAMFKRSPITRNSLLAKQEVVDVQGTFIDLKRTLES